MGDQVAVRVLRLRRLVDVSGVSGIGIVAYGVMFPDGSVVLRWDTKVRSTVFYDSIADVEAITSHGGNTVIEWDDETPGRRSRTGTQGGMMDGTESFEQGAEQSATTETPVSGGDTNVVSDQAVVNNDTDGGGIDNNEAATDDAGSDANTEDDADGAVTEDD